LISIAIASLVVEILPLFVNKCASHRSRRQKTQESTTDFTDDTDQNKKRHELGIERLGCQPQYYVSSVLSVESVVVLLLSPVALSVENESENFAKDDVVQPYHWSEHWELNEQVRGSRRVRQVAGLSEASGLPGQVSGLSYLNDVVQPHQWSEHCELNGSILRDRHQWRDRRVSKNACPVFLSSSWLASDRDSLRFNQIRDISRAAWNKNTRIW
jgi:hypothetical protein